MHAVALSKLKVNKDAADMMIEADAHEKKMQREITIGS